MRDIRLYTYEAGRLIKQVRPLAHKYKSLEDCIDSISNYQLKKYQPSKKTYQFVITEYTGTYESKIIEVITKTYTK